MRGVRRRACVAVVVVASAVAMSAVLVAANAGAAGGPAVVVKGTTCSFDFSTTPLIAGLGTAAVKVENTGTVVLKCVAPRGGIVNETGRTQTYRGFTCGMLSPVDNTTVYFTTDTNATITPDGGAQATCRYSKR